MNTFTKLVQKPISVSMLRHIYITYKISYCKISEQEKYILSQKMGHSITMQSYYRKVDYDSDDEETIASKIKSTNNKNYVMRF